MKQWTNRAVVQGYVYSHTLQEREAGEHAKNPGQKYINGEVQIATDDDGMNIVPVYFTYVTEDKRKDTYDTLMRIILTGTTYQSAGTAATKVRVNGQVEVNDFYGRDGEPVCQQRVSGSFINLTDRISETPATFDLDVLIDSAVVKEVENGDDYMTISGYAFNFRNDLLPITLTVRNAKGIAYFENQDISKKSPLLTNASGKFVSNTIKRVKEVETDWGEPAVDVTSYEVRSWDVTGTSSKGLEFGETITVDELKECVARREETLANVKKRYEERANSVKGKEGFPASTPKPKVEEDEDDFPF